MKDEHRYILRTESIRRRAIGQVQAISLHPDVTPYEVVIRPYKKSRTLAQNRLLHMWLGIIEEYTGNDKDDLRYEFMKMFVESESYTDINGKLQNRVKSTTELNVSEFAKFLNDIEHFAYHDLNITLPHPADLWLEAVYQK